MCKIIFIIIIGSSSKIKFHVKYNCKSGNKIMPNAMCLWYGYRNCTFYHLTKTVITVTIYILKSDYLLPGGQSILILIYFAGIAAETKETFLKNLRRDFPRELVPVVLAPLLYPYKPDLLMDKVNQDNTTMTNTMVSSWEIIWNI